MKKLLLLIGTAVVLTAAFTVVLTARYVPIETPAPPADEVAVLPGAAERLANAIRIRTICAEDEGAFDDAALQNSTPTCNARFHVSTQNCNERRWRNIASCIHGPAATPR
jgi:hypothetical protein